MKKTYAPSYNGKIDYGELSDSYSICSCGAVTVFTKYGLSYSCKAEKRKRFFPGLDFRKLKRLQNSYCCNYCVNHYGLDLCACGSGEPFERCETGFDVCGTPMQVIRGGTIKAAKDAWL